MKKKIISKHKMDTELVWNAMVFRIEMFTNDLTALRSLAQFMIRAKGDQACAILEFMVVRFGMDCVAAAVHPFRLSATGFAQQLCLATDQRVAAASSAAAPIQQTKSLLATSALDTFLFESALCLMADESDTTFLQILGTLFRSAALPQSPFMLASMKQSARVMYSKVSTSSALELFQPVCYTT